MIGYFMDQNLTINRAIYTINRFVKKLDLSLGDYNVLTEVKNVCLT